MRSHFLAPLFSLLLISGAAAQDDGPQGGDSPMGVYDRFTAAIEDRDFADLFVCVDPEERNMFLGQMWGFGYFTCFDMQQGKVNEDLRAEYDALLSGANAPILEGALDMNSLGGLMNDEDAMTARFEDVAEEDLPGIFQVAMVFIMENNAEMAENIDDQDMLDGEPQIDGEWASADNKESGGTSWFHQVDGRWYVALRGPEDRD
jgi:hypothetical protein